MVLAKSVRLGWINTWYFVRNHTRCSSMKSFACLRYATDTAAWQCLHMDGTRQLWSGNRHTRVISPVGINKPWLTTATASWHEAKCPGLTANFTTAHGRPTELGWFLVGAETPVSSPATVSREPSRNVHRYKHSAGVWRGPELLQRQGSVRNQGRALAIMRLQVGSVISQQLSCLWSLPNFVCKDPGIVTRLCDNWHQNYRPGKSSISV